MVRLLQVTDTHVVVPPKLVSGKLNTLGLLEAAVDRLLEDWERLATVDALLVTGDIADDGDLESYRRFRVQIERLNTPYLLIPGNHDRREPLRECFRDQACVPREGKFNWVHDLSSLRVIGLDTVVADEGRGELDEQTLEFLSGTLSDEPEKPTLIAMHHPPFQSGIRFMDGIGLSGIAGLERVLAPATNDIRIVCGHVHNAITGSVGSRVALSGLATCSVFAADYREDAPVGFLVKPGGYTVHDWDNGFRSTSVTLDSSSGPYPF